MKDMDRLLDEISNLKAVILTFAQQCECGNIATHEWNGSWSTAGNYGPTHCNWPRCDRCPGPLEIQQKGELIDPNMVMHTKRTDYSLEFQPRQYHAIRILRGLRDKLFNTVK